MEINRDATREEILKDVHKFMNGVRYKKWYQKRQIGVFEQTTHNVENNTYDYLGCELRCVEDDYTASDYTFIAYVETLDKNRYSDEDGNYHNEEYIIDALVKTIEEEFRVANEYRSYKEDKKCQK